MPTSIARVVRAKLLKAVSMRHPGKVAAQNVNGERCSHKQCTDPKTPVAMHPPPVRTGIGLTLIAAVSFVIMLAPCHLFSICAEYSPRRAARLQRAR
jgi:hypothetical protein